MVQSATLIIGASSASANRKALNLSGGKKYITCTDAVGIKSEKRRHLRGRNQRSLFIKDGVS